MDWGRVQFFLGEVFANFTRNAAMQITAIGTVAVTIVMLGTFLYVRDTLSTFGQGILKQIEIAVYLKDDVDDAQREAPSARSFAADERIVGARYVPRKDRPARDARSPGRDFDTSLLTANPLPNAFRVRVRNADDVPAVAAVDREDSRRRKGRLRRRHGDEAVASTAAVIGRIGLVMIGLLVLTAAIIIANTIRLTVFARRREIAIMQLVGATNMYIRMPFIAEGMLAGVRARARDRRAGARAQSQVVPKIAATLQFIPFHANEPQLAGELVLVGAAVGLVASWFSVGRYLRA